MKKYSVEWYYKEFDKMYEKYSTEELEAIFVETERKIAEMDLGHIVNPESRTAMEMLVFDRKELGI